MPIELEFETMQDKGEFLDLARVWLEDKVSGDSAEHAQIKSASQIVHRNIDSFLNDTEQLASGIFSGELWRSPWVKDLEAVNDVLFAQLGGIETYERRNKKEHGFDGKREKEWTPIMMCISGDGEIFYYPETEELYNSSTSISVRKLGAIASVSCGLQPNSYTKPAAPFVDCIFRVLTSEARVEEAILRVKSMAQARILSAGIRNTWYELQQFLETVDLALYIDIFLENRIDLTALELLTEMDLLSLSIPLEHGRRLLRGLTNFKNGTSRSHQADVMEVGDEEGGSQRVDLVQRNRRGNCLDDNTTTQEGTVAKEEMEEFWKNVDDLLFETKLEIQQLQSDLRND